MILVAAMIPSHGNRWLVTAHPNGQPHVRPVMAVWVEGGLCFCAGESTRKAINLALDSLPLAVELEPLDLVVEGVARQVRDADPLHRVADEYAATYDWHVTVHSRFVVEIPSRVDPGPWRDAGAWVLTGFDPQPRALEVRDVIEAGPG